MFRGQSFRRDQLNVFLYLRSDCFSVPFKGQEFPPAHLIFYFRPKLQYFLTLDVRIDYVASRGHNELDAKLIGPWEHTFQRNCSTIWLDFVCASRGVVIRRIGRSSVGERREEYARQEASKCRNHGVTSKIHESNIQLGTDILGLCLLRVYGCCQLSRFGLFDQGFLADYYYDA